MVLHNPNNWHWVNKDATPWARTWLEDNLTKIEAKEGDVEAKISKVISMDGDVEVAQRKGKVITIFDVKLTLEYSGTYICRIQSTVVTIHLPKKTFLSLRISASSLPHQFCPCPNENLRLQRGKREGMKKKNKKKIET